MNIKGQISLFSTQTHNSIQKREKFINKQVAQPRVGCKCIFIENRNWYECKLQNISDSGYEIYNPAIGRRVVDVVYTDKALALEQIRKNLRISND